MTSPLSALAPQVTSPNGEHVYSAEHEAGGSFAFYATDTGVYVVCFSNEHGTQASLFKPGTTEALLRTRVDITPDLLF
jgi:galactose-1-phosphate uridylyltransferase